MSKRKINIQVKLSVTKDEYKSIMSRLQTDIERLEQRVKDAAMGPSWAAIDARDLDAVKLLRQSIIDSNNERLNAKLKRKQAREAKKAAA